MLALVVEVVGYWDVWCMEMFGDAQTTLTAPCCAPAAGPRKMHTQIAGGVYGARVSRGRRGREGGWC